MNLRERIPVTVLTGFLGAGKSTLLEQWLGVLPAGETAVIVNEWSEVGIDGAQLEGLAVRRLLEISGGCICCRNETALHDALAELSRGGDAPPTRIVVETSGAASPAGVVRAVVQGPTRDAVRLDGIVTVVDGTRLDEVLAFDLAIEQLGFADVVVVSRAAAAAAPETAEVEASVRRHAPAAVVTFANRGMLTGGATLSTVLAQRPETLHPVAAHEGRHAAIEAVSLEIDGSLDETRFLEWMEAILGEVEARILRLKGILAIEGVEARVIVQGVGEAVEVTLGRPWIAGPNVGSGAPAGAAASARTSRLVVLGLGLDGDALRRTFAACRSGGASPQGEGGKRFVRGS